MLNVLDLAIQELPDLLVDRSKWDSLIVNRRKPWTYRVYSQLSNGMRVCLHRFETCHTHEAFSHPHPWPGAFMILQGSYKMNIGYSVDRTSPMNDVMTTVMGKWSKYEIVNPLAWHAVSPLETTYTIMVNDTPWSLDVAHEKVVTTKGKDLDKMPENELLEHLSMFSALVKEYRERS